MMTICLQPISSTPSWVDCWLPVSTLRKRDGSRPSWTRSASPGLWLDRGLESCSRECPTLWQSVWTSRFGLPASPPRLADRAARKFVGPRRSSGFPTPPRALLEAGTYAEARLVAKERFGIGISAQAYALGPKILESMPSGTTG